MNNYLNCECKVCGTKFHRKPSHIAKGEGKYCSRKCFAEAKKQYMKGEGNHQYGIKGNKNSSWKSDLRMKNGYIKIRCAEHPYADESGMVLAHRLIAEQYLMTDEEAIEIDGIKYLKPELHVHHINFDRSDNRPDNLMILSKSEHQRLHAKQQKRERDSLGRYSTGK